MVTCAEVGAGSWVRARDPFYGASRTQKVLGYPGMSRVDVESGRVTILASLREQLVSPTQASWIFWLFKED